MKRALFLLLALAALPVFAINEPLTPEQFNDSRIEHKKVHGISFEQRTYQSLFGDPLVVSILKIAPGKFTAEIAVCEDGNRETTSSFAEKHKAVAAVNAGFFTFDKASRPCWQLKSEGKIYGDQGNPDQGSCFAIDKNGKWSIEPNLNASDDRYSSLVTGNRSLLEKGAIQPDASDQERHPRTAAGIDAAGNLFLVVVDGRAKESAGATFFELATLMKLLGCVDALNLDGGGSSAMYLKGEGIVNFPSDNKLFDHAGERRVHNAIVILPAHR